MFYSDDPIADFERHDAEQERRLRRLPVCCSCKGHIQQESAVRINGDWYCDECIEDMKEDIEEW
jgi:hypothetical protein